ncbi:MAG: phage head closure protein [Succiniclasticum sp.]|nr:phage head closure protein [Succiniclasticum sp.]
MRLKDKKIDILKTTYEKDEEGFQKEILIVVFENVWAYFRQLSGDEYFAAATTNYKEEVLFQINYNPDVNRYNVIRYNGYLYEITRVDNFEGYKNDLTIYCKLRARQK